MMMALALTSLVSIAANQVPVLSVLADAGDACAWRRYEGTALHELAQFRGPCSAVSLQTNAAATLALVMVHASRPHVFLVNLVDKTSRELPKPSDMLQPMSDHAQPYRRLGFDRTGEPLVLIDTPTGPRLERLTRGTIPHWDFVDDDDDIKEPDQAFDLPAANDDFVVRCNADQSVRIVARRDGKTVQELPAGVQLALWPLSPSYCQP